MTETGGSWPRRFFGVIARSATWLNLVYLLLAFPLGLFYFVFLVTALSVGLSLVIIWVGIFILGVTAACWWAFAAFERSLADGLLGTHLTPAPRPWLEADGVWPRIKTHFASAATWKDLVFLFVKFPLGLVSFVVVVTLSAVAGAFLAAPAYYRFATTDTGRTVHHGIFLGIWTVDRLWEALLLVPVGALLVFVALHAFNGLGAMWRGVARGLLPRADDAARAAAGAATAPSAAVVSGRYPPSTGAQSPTSTGSWPTPQAPPRPPSRYTWPAPTESDAAATPSRQTPQPPATGPQATQPQAPYPWPTYPGWQHSAGSYPSQPASAQPAEPAQPVQPGQAQAGGPQPGQPSPGQPSPGQPQPAQQWQLPPWPAWPQFFGPAQGTAMPPSQPAAPAGQPTAPTDQPANEPPDTPGAPGAEPAPPEPNAPEEDKS